MTNLSRQRTFYFTTNADDFRQVGDTGGRVLQNR